VQTITHRSLTVPVAALLFGVILTLPAPTTAEWMPPVTLFVFLFAVIAVTIAHGVGAITRFNARRSPEQARAVRVLPGRSETRHR
jgi:hypothetical protein